MATNNRASSFSMNSGPMGREARIVREALARGQFRDYRKTDSKLKRVSEYVYKYIKTWSYPDKIRIITEYGDASLLNKRTTAEEIDVQLVETLIIRLSMEELDSIMRDVIVDEKNLSKDIVQIRHEEQRAVNQARRLSDEHRRALSSFNIKNLDALSNKVSGYENVRDVRKALNNFDPGRDIRKSITRRYARLGREITNLLNDTYSNEDLNNTAQRMNITFDTVAKRGDLIREIRNKTILFVDMVISNTSSKFVYDTNYDRDTYQRILEHTSFAWVVGKVSASPKELENIRKEAMAARKAQAIRNRIHARTPIFTALADRFRMSRIRSKSKKGPDGKVISTQREEMDELLFGNKTDDEIREQARQLGIKNYHVDIEIVKEEIRKRNSRAFRELKKTELGNKYANRDYRRLKTLVEGGVGLSERQQIRFNRYESDTSALKKAMSSVVDVDEAINDSGSIPIVRFKGGVMTDKSSVSRAVPVFVINKWMGIGDSQAKGLNIPGYQQPVSRVKSYAAETNAALALTNQPLLSGVTDTSARDNLLKGIQGGLSGVKAAIGGIKPSTSVQNITNVSNTQISERSSGKEILLAISNSVERINYINRRRFGLVYSDKDGVHRRNIIFSKSPNLMSDVARSTRMKTMGVAMLAAQPSFVVNDIGVKVLNFGDMVTGLAGSLKEIITNPFGALTAAHAVGGSGRFTTSPSKTTHFISGDSLSSKPNPEQVSIDWDRRSYKVKPIPQFAKGGTEAISGKITRMTSQERNQPMSVGISNSLVTYNKSLPSYINGSNDNTAIKVFSINPSITDMVDIGGGGSASLIGLMVDMTNRLALIENLLNVGNQQRTAVISTAGTIASNTGAIAANSNSSSESFSSDIASPMSSILRGD